MCKNIYTNFYTDFAHFLHLHILHFGLHLRPREETVTSLILAVQKSQKQFHSVIFKQNLRKK